MAEDDDVAAGCAATAAAVSDAGLSAVIDENVKPAEEGFDCVLLLPNENQGVVDLVAPLVPKDVGGGTALPEPKEKVGGVAAAAAFVELNDDGAVDDEDAPLPKLKVANAGDDDDEDVAPVEIALLLLLPGVDGVKVAAPAFIPTRCCGCCFDASDSRCLRYCSVKDVVTFVRSAYVSASICSLIFSANAD